jgi:DNA-binding NtrC family response regulator
MGTSRVLLVDAHESSRMLLARLLRMSGFNVTAAETAGEALELAQDEPFDWLITEISAHDRPEFALMRSLHDRDGTRGIIVTAHDLHWVRGWRQAGFCHVLRKPLEYDRLLAKLRRPRHAKRLANPSDRPSMAAPTRSHFHRPHPAAFVATAMLN